MCSKHRNAFPSQQESFGGKQRTRISHVLPCQPLSRRRHSLNGLLSIIKFNICSGRTCSQQIQRPLSLRSTCRTIKPAQSKPASRIEFQSCNLEILTHLPCGIEYGSWPLRLSLLKERYILNFMCRDKYISP